MIYTVTFNPSLDYYVSVRNFRSGTVNRSEEESVLPGGKGINVSLILSALGLDSTALGFTAGFTGAEIRRRLKMYGIQDNFIRMKHGMSRINTKIRSVSGDSAEGWLKDDPISVPNTGRLTETAINGRGPDIGEEDIGTLYARLRNLVDNDFLVLSGNIPPSLPKSMYKNILEFLKGRKVQAVVDAEGDLLTDTLLYHPFLIKPNREETSGIFGRDVRTRADALVCAREFQKMGARNVIISLGSEGSVLRTEDGQAMESPALSGKVVSTVGAGDACVAGFLAGFSETGDYRKAFRVANCTSAACVAKLTLPTREDVAWFMQKYPQ